jgi:hypothetical protein
LDKEQTKLLEYVFRNDAVSDPERVMKNPVVLDRHFKRTFKIIERNSETEEAAQERLVRLFALRNALDSAPSDEGAASSRIAENSQASLVYEGGSYSVRYCSPGGKMW